MKKPQKMIRIRYHEGDEKFPEGFALEALHDGSWSLMLFAPLHRCEEDEPNAEKNFIHFSIMRELANCLELGYSFYWC